MGFRDLLPARWFGDGVNPPRYRLIRSRDLWRTWEEDHLRRLLRHFKVDCVFDVGANVGQYAGMLRQKAGYTGLIISFEPIPEAAAALREKAAGDPKWIVEEMALGGEDGARTFHIMRESEFSSLGTPRHDEVDLFRGQNQVAKAVEVPVQTLDTAFRRLREAHGFERPFLKLDTQGSDVDVVSHGQGVIGSFVGLQSELAVKKLYDHSVDFREAITYYERCGFSLSAFVPNNQGHFPRLVETDCIMVRSDLL